MFENLLKFTHNVSDSSGCHRNTMLKKYMTLL